MNTKILVFVICAEAIIYYYSITYITVPLSKVFKGGLSNFCGRHPLKNLKGYGLLKQTRSLQDF